MAHNMKRKKSRRGVGAPDDNRIHTRILIWSCGKPIFEFESILELLCALRDAIKGHFMMYSQARILHRDISIYNIMIGPDGRGFVIDLDYAVHRDRLAAASSHRTGTLPFMSISILEGSDQHYYRDDIESFFYEEQQQQSQPQQQTRKRPLDEEAEEPPVKRRELKFRVYR